MLSLNMNSIPVYDIRLYNMQGTRLHQQQARFGKIEFNLSNLPNGIYFLHIYDGLHNMPDIHKIVVKH